MKYRSRRVQLEHLAEILAKRTFGIKTWIPREERLVGAPELLPGEALSSWCHRIRAHFSLRDATLRRVLGLKSPLHWLDVGGGTLDLERISSLVMHSTESLQSLAWPRFANDCLPVLACLTTLPLEQRPIVRYCENCLREDAEPYFRQFWRFAFAYGCPLHGSVLRDQCPHCRIPLGTSYFGAAHSTASLRNCPNCSGNLAEVQSTLLPKDLVYQVLDMQLELANFVNPGADFVKAAIGEACEGNYDFMRRNGVIDVSSEKNARKLYMTMLSMALSPPETEGLRSRFSPYLMKRDIGPNRAVALGLDGWSIFGNKAAILPFALSNAQLLSSGTFWWSSFHQEEVYQLMPMCDGSRLDEAITWIRRLVES